MSEDLMSCFRLSIISIRNDNKRGLHENGGRADAGREHRLGG